MNKIISLSAALIGLGCIALAGAAEKAAAAPQGKKIYDAKCASCHGKDGKGNANMAKVFKVEPQKLDMTVPETTGQTDEALLKVIAEGRAKMPGYAKQLKAEDQKAVLEYMRGLSKPKEEAKPEMKQETKPGTTGQEAKPEVKQDANPEATKQDAKPEVKQETKPEATGQGAKPEEKQAK